MTIGIIGAGAMGSGIAQVAATAGHKVKLFDANPTALSKAKELLQINMTKLTEKQKISQDKANTIIASTEYVSNLENLAGSDLIIEAIIENLEVKQQVFSSLDKLVKSNCILASNTSSLSITSIASACEKPERVIGLHFFNPAPLMPLVEIIPGIATKSGLAEELKQLMLKWGKTPVICKDTPGFIVNRIARPFYGEAMRIFEEGIADIATIDWAMKEFGGFKMGPFELTDLIGHDVNYVVTETVWKQFYFDPRFKPALCQKRLVEARFFGRKSGKGFYNYQQDATTPEPNTDKLTGEQIFMRILSMLINEAADALYMQVASKEDIDLAMTKGVNYPKGLLKWADDIGLEHILNQLQLLQEEYQEDRYRPHVLLKRMVSNKQKFYN